MPEIEQRVLMLITDEPAQCRLISAIAAREGWRTVNSRDPASARAMLQTREGLELNAIIVDQCAVGEDACALIADFRAHRPSLPILLLTASASPLFAVEAMRAGASDYLIKPVAPDRLMHSLRAAAFREARQDELAPLAEKLPCPADFEAMIGAAPTFRAALAVAAKAARGHGNVLVEGECGTGKEMLVRAMQAASMRAKAPLQIVDIGTTPASSIKSLLFGHERDAFPGAFTRHIGALQRCDGGTLVIDEIDRLPAPLQLRLVDAIRHGSVRPVGAQHSFRVDVRLIVGQQSAAQGPCRAGPFHSRTARSDRAGHRCAAAVARAQRRHRRACPPFPRKDRRAARAARTRHHRRRAGAARRLRLAWKCAAAAGGALPRGGVLRWRRADSCGFSAAVSLLNGGDGTPAVVAQQESSGVMLYTDDGNLRPLEEIELDVIRLAIGLYRGRMTEVARRLGIGRSTLYRKLGELGIDNAA